MSDFVARGLAMWHLRPVVPSGYEASSPPPSPGDVLLLYYPDDYGFKEPAMLLVCAVQDCVESFGGCVVATDNFDGDLEEVHEHPTRCVWEVKYEV